MPAAGYTPPMWQNLLADFFRARGADTAEILDASACREGWIQAELFREFHRAQPAAGFVVNEFSYPNAPRNKADLSASSPGMVGELKVLGARYQRKVLTGRAGTLEPLLQRLSRPIGPRDRQRLQLGNWGLVPDYFRLRDGAPRGAERLLVLVGDVSTADKDAVAVALRGISFRGTEVTVQMPRGFAKTWRV